MNTKLIQGVLDMADKLIRTIEGTAAQFADEVAALAAAASALEEETPAGPAVTGNQHGLRCPKCGHDDQLNIAATVWLRLCPDGTDITAARNGDNEWDDTAIVLCCNCDFDAPITFFRQDDADAA